MLLSQLMKGIKVKNEYEDADAVYLTADSRKIKEGAVFICVEGKNFDGHTVAEEMTEKGAVAVVCKHDVGVKNQIIVNDTRSAFSIMCANFFGNPAKKLKLIGLTGTNGKTTTTFLIKQILDSLGKKSGLIGTVKNMIGDEELPSSLTTPECFELQSLFAKMVEAKCEYCIMEVSSQALDQGRVDGCKFMCAVFTNLTRDHLDYHGTFENYAEAKSKLFKIADTCIVNLDDPHAGRMVMGVKGRVVTYSEKQDAADYTAKYIRMNNDSIEYELVTMGAIEHVKLPIPGEFSVYNSMAAAVCVSQLGFEFGAVCEALSKCHGVKGRIEVVPTAADYTVIIDYAHSPDGLENILTSLRRTAKGRIITVFGCGGDRDRTKRPIMGTIAAKLSDYIVVTSDNPRSEDPVSIIDEILAGVKGIKVAKYVEPDRTKAIAHALSQAKKDDIVLLAGKGHETYQILSTGKIHYDEREIVRDILSGKIK